MSEDVTLPDVINAALDSRLLDLHTAMPGKVQAYHASRNSVDVIPQLYRQIPTDDGDFADEALPVLPDVPICFPQAGGFSVTFPIQAGDYVLIVFCESPLGAWRSNGVAGSPGDIARHHLSGAVAIPGVFPMNGLIPSPSTTNMVMGKNGTAGAQIEITPSEVHIGAGATSFIALADKVASELSSISSAVSTILAHTHTVSGGSTAVSANIGSGYSNGSVAAATSRAK